VEHILHKNQGVDLCAGLSHM